MWKILLLAIVFYFLFQLITRFILPVYVATRRMRDQFRNIREQRSDNVQQNSPAPPPQEKEKAGEYIDFEEVK